MITVSGLGLGFNGVRLCRILGIEFMEPEVRSNGAYGWNIGKVFADFRKSGEVEMEVRLGSEPMRSVVEQYILESFSDHYASVASVKWTRSGTGVLLPVCYYNTDDAVHLRGRKLSALNVREVILRGE